MTRGERPTLMTCAPNPHKIARPRPRAFLMERTRSFRSRAAKTPGRLSQNSRKVSPAGTPPKAAQPAPGLPWEELFLDGLAKQVHDHGMHFLDAGGHPVGNSEAEVHLAGQGTSVSPGEANRFHFPFPASCHRLENIRGVSAGADSERHIAWRAQCLHLTAKDQAKITVVRDTRQDRCIRGERDGGEGG